MLMQFRLATSFASNGRRKLTMIPRHETASLIFVAFVLLLGGLWIPGEKSAWAQGGGKPPHIPDNATLRQKSTTDYPSGIWRDDFASGVGAPPVQYIGSNRRCSLNDGAGDDGSQVRSADGKCWTARFPIGPRDVRIWGASPGEMDSRAKIAAALSTGPITGAGLGYGISGGLTLPDGADVSDIAFTQLSPGEETRTLFAKGGSSIMLRNVKVNMNAASNVGRVGKAAGIYLAGVAFPMLDKVEVYGGGIGFGIAVTDCARAIAVDLYVHDLQWSAASDPGREQVFGISFIRCSNVSVINPRIRRLTGVIGGRPSRPYQTDGLGFGGVTNATVVGGEIDSVGEGTDTAGSLLTSNLWIYGTVYRNIDSHAVKLGSIRDSGAIGVRCYDAGLDCGTTGANHTTPPGFGAAHIKFVDVQAYDTGSNGRWGNPTGFTLGYDGTPGVRPVDIQCINCIAKDSKGRMKFGFLADPGTSFALINPFASGYAQAPFHDNGRDAQLPTTSTMGR